MRIWPFRARAAQLTDHLGRPVETRTLRREVATASAGSRRAAIYPLWPGLTPGMINAVLREAVATPCRPERFFALAEEMEERDLHYAGVAATRRRSVAQLPISVLPADDSAAAAEHAAFVQQWLGRESLPDELIQMLDAITKGVSVLEIDWSTDAGPWLPSALIHRDARWFTTSGDGRAVLLRSDETPAGTPLPPYKFIVHTHIGKAGHTLRAGLARPAIWAVAAKWWGGRWWDAFIEVFGTPLRLGRYSPGASGDEKDALLDGLRALGAEGAAAVPDSMSIEFIEASPAHADLFERRARYVDEQLSKLFLGQVATTDAISGGHAVSREHRLVQEDIERSDAAQVSGTLNRDLVRPMIDLNFGAPAAGYPKIVLGRTDPVDVAALVDAAVKLVPLGLQVDRDALREVIGLPEPAPDGEVLTPPAKAAPAGEMPPDEDAEPNPPDPRDAASAGAMSPWRHDMAEPPALAAERGDDAIDRLVDALARSGQFAEAFSPVEAELAAAFAAAGSFFAAAGSFAELQEEVSRRLKDMTPERFGELLARADFAAASAAEAGAGKA